MFHRAYAQRCLLVAAVLGCGTVSIAADAPAPTVLGPNDPSPTPITLHYKDAPTAEVFKEIGRQMGVPVRFFPSNSDAAITIDVDRQPFWTVLAQLCAQTHRNFGWGGGNASSPPPLLLQQAGQPARKLLINGPVAATLMSISHWDELKQSPESQDHCMVTFMLNWEPRLGVLFYQQETTPDEAVDEHGLSLMPPPEPPADTPRPMRVFRPFGSFQPMNQFEGQRQTQAVQSIRLHVPPEAGRRIAHLKGRLGLFVAGDQQVLEISDLKSLSHQRHKSFLFGKTTSLELQQANVNDTQVVVQFQMHKESGEADDAWHRRSLLLSVSHIRILDADGKDWAEPQNRINLGWGDATIYVEIGMSRKTGVKSAPAKIVITGPVNARPIDVPYDFKDLPLP